MIDRIWSPNQVALKLGASFRDEEGELRLGLEALCNHRQIAGPAHAENGAV